MAGKRGVLVAGLWMVLAAAPGAIAQNPVINPGFESDFTGWTKYVYTAPPSGSPAEPVVGCIGASPCLFDTLSPPSTPQGSKVCGMQATGTAKNGGVYQSFNWVGGPATLSVTARAYSEKFAGDGGGPWDTGCKVRMGLVAGGSHDRADVTSWVTFPWGDAWFTRSISVPGSGLYTLFIESLQPGPAGIMSTLWDNVTWAQLPPITSTDVTVIKPGDAGSPESTVRIEWTTSVPSTSRVDYGTAGSYGQVVQDAQLTTNHSVLLTGLSHTTAYHCRASSTATGYTPWASDDVVFKTPIQFSGIFVNPSPSGSNFTVRWTTDVQATTRVEYGLTTSYGSFTTENMSLVTIHQAALIGLQADQTYHFRVWGQNSPNYTNACSTDQILFTLPAPSAQLQNGGFENGYGAQPRSLYPWIQYTTGDGSHPIDGLVGPYPQGGTLTWLTSAQSCEGCFFLGAGANWSHKDGGVFQRVSSPPGQICTLAARYMFLNVGGVPTDTQVRLGIDPNGGVDPAGSNVQWWSLYSPAGDSQWHTAAVTTAAGAGGIVTVFLDFREQWSLEWHVAAIDRVVFGPPVTMTIGQLKNSEGDRGVTLEGKIVTLVDPNPVSYSDKGYVRGYVEEEDRSAGIAVLFDQSMPDIPTAGDRVTLTGSVVLNNMEAMLIAYQWTTVDSGILLPRPLGLRGNAIGGATPIQPALFAGGSVCNVGLRVRVFGRVNWVDSSQPWIDATAIIDDGSRVLDQNPIRGTVERGIRVKLVHNGVYGVQVGDYIAATGVVSVEFVDPVWPPNSGDEYCSYTVLTASADSWHTIPG